MATIMGADGPAGGAAAGAAGVYAGDRPECGIGCGGTAEVVRVTTLPNGGGEVWVECLSCAQRVRHEVPPATDAERQVVARDLETGRETTCPRHASRVTLARRGRRLSCPMCGVVYRD